MTKITRIYLTMYGTYWSLTRKQFLELAAEVLKGNGSFDLSNCKQLIKKPASIRQHDGYAYSISSKTEVLAPLDYDLEDWAAVVDRLMYKNQYSLS